MTFEEYKQDIDALTERQKEIADEKGVLTDRYFERFAPFVVGDKVQVTYGNTVEIAMITGGKAPTRGDNKPKYTAKKIKKDGTLSSVSCINISWSCDIVLLERGYGQNKGYINAM